MKFYSLILIYALSMTSANIFLKFASQAQGLRWWIFFALANVTGFASVIALPFALKLSNPNLVYALAIGGGFTFLQLASCLLFREALSSWQWGGIALITLGIVLLQIRS